MRGLIHHIDLSVSDLERSRLFYDALLTFIGYRRAEDYPDGTDWLLATDGVFHSIGIVAAAGPDAARRHTKGSPGLHHLAWTAAAVADVDALHALLVGIGAVVLDPPACYPQYGPDYYAVFFADPDGMKLEFVAGSTRYADR